MTALAPFKPKRGVAFTEPQELGESDEETLFAGEICNGVKFTVPATNSVDSDSLEFQCTQNKNSIFVINHLV